MIAFMPNIYEDELCYSLFARYFCHSGYSKYGHALDDLFIKRNLHFNAEFFSRLNNDAKKVITDMIPMEKLILEHTMFPIVRFMDPTRMKKSLECMVKQEGKVVDLLPIPKSKSPRYLRYCPICAKEQRKKFGEAFWTRTANINSLDICVKHRCRLKDTDIAISGKLPPRFYIAEQEIKDAEPEFMNDGLELQFSEYLTKAFHAPINSSNSIKISDFLQSKLEGTKYLNVTGIQRYISLLFNDYGEFYKDMPNKRIAELMQMEKIFVGRRSIFYEVCQIAFFLNIEVKELVSPMLPKKTQKDLFTEKVTAFRNDGLSYQKIADILGADHNSVERIGKRVKGLIDTY